VIKRILFLNLCVLLGGLFMIYSAATRTAENDLPPAGIIQEGDLVFRIGNSQTSWPIYAVQAGGWTHVGFVVRDELGRPAILHSDTPNAPGEPDGVRVEALETYSKHAASIAFYRDASGKGVAAARKALTLVGVPFDNTFEDPKKIYCAEVILMGYDAIGVTLPVKHHSLGKLNVFFPNDFSTLPGFNKVWPKI
jgi:hypothetical protein